MIPPDNVFFYDIGGEFFAEKVKMTTKVVRTVLRLPIQFQKIPPDRHKKSFLGGFAPPEKLKKSHLGGSSPAPCLATFRQLQAMGTDTRRQRAPAFDAVCRPTPTTIT